MKGGRKEGKEKDGIGREREARDKRKKRGWKLHDNVVFVCFIYLLSRLLTCIFRIFKSQFGVVVGYYAERLNSSEFVYGVRVTTEDSYLQLEAIQRWSAICRV